MGAKKCDDCGKTVARRQNCRHCAMLVCGRCYQDNHYHEIEARRQDAKDAAWSRLYGPHPRA